MRFFSVAAAASSFNVVGWYVGSNETGFPLDAIDWDIYSTIRCGELVINKTTRVATCPTDAFFKKCLATAVAHGKEVTLAPGSCPLDECLHKRTDAAKRTVCDAYISSVGPAVRSCGPGVTGIEIDHEGTDSFLGKGGIVSAFERRGYSEMLDGIQKSMGGAYTVGADIGSWSSDGIFGRGDSYPFGFTPWVDREIFAANKNLFVNTMSYHWPTDCSIAAWKHDAWVTHTVWGLAKDQINLGIGYYSTNITKSPRKINPVVSGEPTWNTLSKRCPGLASDVCVCDDVYFVSRQMNYDIAAFVREEGYRGLFPWAANYDSPDPAEALISWLGKGLGLGAPEDVLV